MVKLITSTQELLKTRSAETEVIGFVPTMGNLHAGHISLLEAALKDFDHVYFSIFVNPTQFGPNEDFNQYPRTLEKDLKLIEDLLINYPGKEVVVYSPKHPQEVYTDDIKNRVISVKGLKDIIEGAIRPGHFDGVATVVFRLFELVKPYKTYFGLKDYQQFLVIKRMIQDLNLPIMIQGMPIIREPTGLALSSRNQYLSPQQKEKSLLLNYGLKQIEDTLAGDKLNIPVARELITKLKNDCNWNYLELRDADTLDEDLSSSSKVTILGVYQLGTTRLLDNRQMELK